MKGPLSVIPGRAATTAGYNIIADLPEAPDSCFDAFSSREPVSTSLENALSAFRRRMSCSAVSGTGQRRLDVGNQALQPRCQIGQRLAFFLCQAIGLVDTNAGLFR